MEVVVTARVDWAVRTFTTAAGREVVAQSIRAMLHGRPDDVAEPLAAYAAGRLGVPVDPAPATARPAVTRRRRSRRRCRRSSMARRPRQARRSTLAATSRPPRQRRRRQQRMNRYGLKRRGTGRRTFRTGTRR